MTANNDFFTAAELSHMLGRSPRTLQRWHSNRQGPPRSKIGTLIVYRRSAVQDWMRAQAIDGGTR